MQLCQEKFADELEMTFAPINHWENGPTKPSPLTLKQIYTFLNQLGDKGEVLRTTYTHGEISSGKGFPT